MKITFFFLFLVTLATAPRSGADETQGLSRDEVCSIADPALIASKDIPLVPEYFFRPFPKSNRIAVASKGSNYFVDLDTGEATPVSGAFDALPLPDEKFWIYPTGSSVHFQKLISGQFNKTILADDQMDGQYQSAGVMKNPDGSTRYRVIIDGSTANVNKISLHFQDYQPSADGEEIRSVYDHPKVLCGNLKGAHSLPMLSKDGTKISLLDVKAGHTKIYDVDPASGNCQLKKELFQATGKVDFSFDNKTITYHTVQRMDANLAAHDGWMIAPKAKMVANVWTLNLETGETKQITHFTDSSALYPAFNAQGNILVRKFNPKGGSTILTYDPSKETRSIDSTIFNSKSSCSKTGKLESLATLGQLFSNLCIGEDADFSAASKAAFAMNLDKQSCERLARTFGDSTKSIAVAQVNKNDPDHLLNSKTLSQLNVKDLLQICPQEEIKGERNKLATLSTNQAPPDLSKVPQAMDRCLTCHGSKSALPMPFNDVGALKAMLLKPALTHPGVSLLEEMKGRVDSRSVPPANNLGAKSLTDEETDQVVNWLNALEKNH